VKNQIITDIDEFLIHIKRCIIDEDTIWERLTHLIPISSYEEISCEDILLWQSEGMHECTTSQEIEVLIISTELYITCTVFLCYSNTIISLHDRIEELLKRDTLTFLIALREVVTIQHLGNRKVLGEFTYSCKIYLIKSLTIVVYFEF
jgi:hypothetical protein